MKIYKIEIIFKDKSSIKFDATNYEETEKFIKCKDEIHDSMSWYPIQDISELHIDYIGKVKESMK